MVTALQVDARHMHFKAVAGLENGPNIQEVKFRVLYVCLELRSIRIGSNQLEA
jgi:hypothetical protein